MEVNQSELIVLYCIVQYNQRQAANLPRNAPADAKVSLAQPCTITHLQKEVEDFCREKGLAQRAWPTQVYRLTTKLLDAGLIFSPVLTSKHRQQFAHTELGKGLVEKLREYPVTHWPTATVEGKHIRLPMLRQA